MYIISQRRSPKTSYIPIPKCFQFLLHLKSKVIKLSVKTRWRLDTMFLIWLICLFLLDVIIMNDSLLKLFKVLRKKKPKATCVLRLWWWHINNLHNVTLPIVKNHCQIIYNKVLKNRAKTGVPFISIYNLLWFSYSFKKDRFILDGGVIAPNAAPQLCHCQ